MLGPGVAVLTQCHLAGCSTTFTVVEQIHMSQHRRFWYISHCQAMKANKMSCANVQTQLQDSTKNGCR